MAEMPLFDRLESRDHDGEERVFRVSEVNRAVRFALEDQWASVLIEGELSDVRRSQQGHVYFSRAAVRVDADNGRHGASVYADASRHRQSDVVVARAAGGLNG